MFGYRRRSRLLEDEEIGRLEYEDPNGWKLTHELDGRPVEITIDGDRDALHPSARKTWLDVRDKLPRKWQRVTGFARRELKKLNAPWEVRDTTFKLWSVSVHRKGGFDGAELVFWFEIDEDPDGAYYVSLIEGEPFYLHRDA